MKRYGVIGILVVFAAVVHSGFKNDVPADKAALGKLLFFDPILSRDSTVSCATCHKPGFAFADTSAVSFGVDSVRGVRNTPSAMNLSLQQIMFWDGRAKNMEEQALAPIENPDEMNLPVAEALSRLKHHGHYSSYFHAIFNSEPTRENLAQAIAAFERTLETTESPFDAWKFSDDPAAVSDAAKRGFVLFNEKGKCIKCHFGSNLNLAEFHNIGLFNGRELNDSGRWVVSHKEEDIGRFKVAPLRNVAVTGPYMHNGMFKTLRQVIDFYNDPGAIVPDAINRDTILAKPLGLTEAEKADLEAFLLSLTDKQFTQQQFTYRMH